MIKTTYLQLKTNTPLKSHFEKLGYDISQNVISVAIEHIKRESNYEVDCICDECGNDFKQRISRNTDTCYECRKNQKRKSFQKSDDTLKYPNFRDWKNEIFQFTEKKSCIEFLNKKYDISLNYITFNEILKRLNIEYHQPDYSNIVSDIKKKMGREDIIKKHNIPVSNLRSICKTHSLEMPKTKALINRNTIEENWNRVLELNEKYDIPTIIKKLNFNFSETLLRNVFYEKDVSIKQHSYNKSNGELEVRDFIRSFGIECHSVKKKLSIGYREIDCFCPELNTGFEYCGLWHHSINAGTHKRYHEEKTSLFLKEYGIKIITIFENEWLEKKDIVKSIIKSKLGLSDERVFARKTEVKDITASDAREFHEKYHIHEYVNSSINIGCFFKDELIGCMSFSKSRYDKSFEYEITRMSFKNGYSIVGGASKMFKFANLKSVMTYVDLRFGDGKVYEKIGFEYAGKTPPNYFYNKKGLTKLESRIKYQKHKLKKLLDDYDDSLTEYENMARNNFLAIYDCGNNKWEFKGEI